MVGACICMVAVASPAVAVAVAAGPNSNLAPRRGFFRMSCRHSTHAAARSSGRARARSSRREPAEAEAETDAGVARILKDDSGYLWTLGLGSLVGAAVIKYGSILLPDITRPNIVLALLMVSLPVVAAVFILLKASSAEG
ncbi:hypothetical protein BS78_04G310600 [Paspalum vaginatum]|nr:hypothetical protein BS78_04G310600 [Paspalum vaginatum]